MTNGSQTPQPDSGSDKVAFLSTHPASAIWFSVLVFAEVMGWEGKLGVVCTNDPGTAEEGLWGLWGSTDFAEALFLSHGLLTAVHL